MYLSAGELQLYLDTFCKGLDSSNGEVSSQMGHTGVANLAKEACERLNAKGIVDPTLAQIREEMQS